MIVCGKEFIEREVGSVAMRAKGEQSYVTEGCRMETLHVTPTSLAKRDSEKT